MILIPERGRKYQADHRKKKSLRFRKEKKAKTKQNKTQPTRKFLELTLSIFIAGYIISMWQAVPLEYSNQKHTKEEIKVKIQFSIAPTLKHLERNLAKEGKDVHSEAFKPREKEIKEIL